MDDYSSTSIDDLIFMGIVCLFLVQIVVGVVQIFAALIRTIIKVNKKESIGKLKTYWIMVGIYSLIFACIYYFREILSNASWYSDYWKWHITLLCVQIVWIFIAWGIAIWYCIKIVFVKSKKEPITLIN